MYSSLKDPWLVLPMEVVQGITYGGVWSIAAVYINAPAGKDRAPLSQHSIMIKHGVPWSFKIRFPGPEK